jgi:nucleoid-associated protein YgaU
MQKDLKTGMIFALVLIAVVALWLSTHQGLSVKSRMLKQNFVNSQTQTPTFQKEPAEEQSSADEEPRFTMNLPKTYQSPSSLSIGTRAQAQQPQSPEETDESLRENGKTNPYIHVVLKGETLWSISQKCYGSVNKWQKIFDANRSQLKDENRLRPGMRLIIPR